MEVVVERLLHTEEAKEKSRCDSGDDKAIMTKRNRSRGPQYHYCKKYGHIEKNCIIRRPAEEKDNNPHVLNVSKAAEAVPSERQKEK